jgi:2-C-methyl-D-erythritol 4-phosphate cytidylyltransferase
MNPQPAATSPRLYALVPCAGVGTRAGVGGPKQYALLDGQTMVARTLRALAAVPRLTATLVVLSPDDAQFELAVPGFAQGEQALRQWLARSGGATRAATVANGLDELRAHGARANDWVLVHDAARCLLRPAWVDRLIDVCLPDAVGGLLALPLADTLKHEGQGALAGRVAHTVDRAGKWAAQTPQMFRLGTLTEALAQAQGAVTDEASAIEALGLAPKLVPGEAENFKLTYPGDFALAERLLRTL